MVGIHEDSHKKKRFSKMIANKNKYKQILDTVVEGSTRQEYSK